MKILPHRTTWAAWAESATGTARASLLTYGSNDAGIIRLQIEVGALNM